MQTLGSEWGRACIHPDFWANLLKLKIDELTETYEAKGCRADFVVDDLRFPNELKVLRELGATIVRIGRPGYKHDTSHESEAHVLPSDHAISNDGLPSELYDKLDRFIEGLKK
jgi:hypothetical protein